MAFQKVPINSKPYKNIDDILNSNGSSDALIDGYIDEAGYKNKRPGIDSETFVNVATSKKIDGLYWWTSRKCLVIVSGGRVFKVTDSMGTFVDITGDLLQENIRPTFVDYGNNILITNGIKMVFTDSVTNSEVIGQDGLNYTCIRSHVASTQNVPISGPDYLTYWVQSGSSGVAWVDGESYLSAKTTYISDVDAPQDSTHIAFLDTYVLANFPGTGDFGYSNVADFRTWDALDFAVTEGNPDNGVALLVNNGMIYLIGERSIEIFYNDGETPFARYGQSFVDSGCSAKYTAIFIMGQLYYLDQNKKFNRMNGTVPQVISTPFDKVIQSFGTVEDAFADYIQADGKMFYVVTFPSENITIAYDIISDSWYQWGYWNQNNGTYDRFYPNCYAYCPEWGIHVVGDRYTGKVYKFGKDYYQDIDNVIRMLTRTGHIDHGTSIRKRSNAAILKLKSGEIDGGKVRIRWKNDGNNFWGNYHEVSLKDEGVTNFYAKLKRLGMYRSRQYEIIHTDNAPFAIADMEEDIEGLRG